MITFIAMSVQVYVYSSHVSSPE